MLLDPENYYLPYYIGKGSGNRVTSHFKLTNNKFKHNSRLYQKIEKLKENNKELSFIFWKKDLSENEAYELEESLIVKFGREGYEEKGILTNIIIESGRPPGGKKGMKQSIPRSEQHLANWRQSRIGRLPTNETRLLWKAQRIGKKAKPETIEKFKIRSGGENNLNSLNWIIITPDNIEHKVKGLRAWCRKMNINYYDVYNSKKGYISKKFGTGLGGPARKE
jgi:hypothetical protein